MQKMTDKLIDVPPFLRRQADIKRPINLGHGPSAILRNVNTAPGRKLTPDEIAVFNAKTKAFFEEKDDPKGS